MVPSTLEQVDIGFDVVADGDRVEQKVEGAGGALHLASSVEISTSSAPSARVLPFSGEVVIITTLGAHRAGEFDAHMAEPAEADDADLLAGPDVPVAQRRIGGDPGAKQRRHRLGVELSGTLSTKRWSTTIRSE